MLLRISLTLIMLVMLMGTGCSPPRLCPDAIAPTPEQAAQLMLPIGVQHVTILGVRDWQSGKVVIFEAEQPPGSLKLGFALVQPRLGCGWVLRASGMDQIILTPALQSLVRLDGQSYPGMPLVMVYGRLLDPQIAAVEVTFDNGAIRRETIRERMFLLNEPSAQIACSLRLFDRQDQVIQQLDDLSTRLFPPWAHLCPSP
jgi:hypothetical protein